MKKYQMMEGQNLRPEGNMQRQDGSIVMCTDQLNSNTELWRFTTARTTPMFMSISYTQKIKQDTTTQGMIYLHVTCTSMAKSVLSIT